MSVDLTLPQLSCLRNARSGVVTSRSSVGVEIRAGVGAGVIVLASDLDAFMTTMVAASAPVSCDEAAKFAREHYGLDAAATRLTGERDENFKLS